MSSMETPITSSSARESRRTRRMMSRALSFSWVSAGDGKLAIRPATRSALARSGFQDGRRTVQASRTTLVKDARADGSKCGSANDMADARVAPERNQNKGGAKHAGEYPRGEGILNLNPRRAHASVQVDTDEGRDGDAQQHRPHGIDTCFGQHGCRDMTAAVAQGLECPEVPLVLQHGEVDAGQDDQGPDEEADGGREVEKDDGAGQDCAKLGEEIPLVQNLADEVHVISPGGVAAAVLPKLEVGAGGLVRELTNVLSDRK